MSIIYCSLIRYMQEIGDSVPSKYIKNVTLQIFAENSFDFSSFFVVSLPNFILTPADDKDDAEDHEVLGELENIDDDCEQAGVPFVKIDNDAEAKEYGIDDLPTLVYFENRIPSIYEGEIEVSQDKFISLMIPEASWCLFRCLLSVGQRSMLVQHIVVYT